MEKFFSRKDGPFENFSLPNTEKNYKLILCYETRIQYATLEVKKRDRRHHRPYG